ncbi:MAG: tRNA threonylcarbamoyladenosine dehydratase [Tenericutes bacterium]|jgi:tRNA A37 threonylcarbamoyladenosine dehydratase|nr:tRNA threonylcarbamoyladenosine dehydratase [Mycoplasmatota bacterium]
MQFNRLKILINDDNFNKIKNTKVLILGLGGVGSYVVESLVRSGFNHLILVDYDHVDITNLNRQIMTNLNNIGHKKGDVLKDRILSINRDCQVTFLDMFYSEESNYILDKYNIDYIVDACDTINSKKSIIKYAINHNINIISCMGTGNKMDPSKLSITDINHTTYDPIAKILRKWLKEENIKNKIMVVSSIEKPIKLNGQIIGSNSFVPGTAGLLIASYIIKNIIK